MYSPVNNMHGRYSMYKRIQVIGIGANERQRGISMADHNESPTQHISIDGASHSSSLVLHQRL
jgi:hypothetical protein